MDELQQEFDEFQFLEEIEIPKPPLNEKPIPMAFQSPVQIRPENFRV